MCPFDIIIAYISWQGGGKRRPVLVITKDKDSATVFRITSKYEKKSEAIRAKYLKINDWSQAGLEKLSYVDTSGKRELPLDTVNNAPVGRLSENDKMRLLVFLMRNGEVL